MIRKHLGGRIFDQNNEHHLISWLGQQEDQHKIALYQCDFTFGTWTQRCIRQADCILIVGLGQNAPSVGKVRYIMHISFNFKILHLLYNQFQIEAVEHLQDFSVFKTILNPLRIQGIFTENVT